MGAGPLSDFNQQRLSQIDTGGSSNRAVLRKASFTDTGQFHDFENQQNVLSDLGFELGEGSGLNGLIHSGFFIGRRNTARANLLDIGGGGASELGFSPGVLAGEDGVSQHQFGRRRQNPRATVLGRK